jgi:hypothetical protein
MLLIIKFMICEIISDIILNIFYDLFKINK